MPVGEHRGLSWAEKDEVDAKGRTMKEREDDLYNGCIHVHLHYTNHGSDFGEARKRLKAVYTQLKAEQYFDSLGLEDYNEGLKALAHGRTHMFNAFGRGEIDSVKYNDLFKKMQACEKACGAYAQAWQKIRDFDKKNPKTSGVKRAVWKHAFSTQQADMGEMRGLLAELGRPGAPRS
jgi:hypothetical protein